MNGESIDKLARNLAAAVPDSLRSIGDELEKNFRSVLQAGLAKLDLVTREEFEVQEAVLKRTREKLEAMESRLAAVEKSPPAGAKKKTARKSAKKKSKKKKKKKAATKKPAGKKPAAKKPAGKKPPKKKSG